MTNIRTLYTVHKWLGLTIGLWLMLAASTGTIWTVRNAVETSANERLLSSPCLAAPSSTTWRTALLTEGERITRIDAHDNDFRLLRVATTDRNGTPRIRHIDQCTGTMLKSSDAWERFMSAVTWLHGTLVPGSAGKLAIVLFGLFTMILLSFGVWLWWIRSGRSMRKGLTISSSRQGMARLRSWHQVVGAAAAPLLILSIVSGSTLALSPWLIVSPAPASHCGDQGSSKGLEPHLNFIFRIAKEQVPDGAIRSVRIDGKNCIARLYLRSRSVPLESLIDRVWIALPEERIIAHSRGAAAGIGDRSRAWALTIHSGDLFGRSGWLLTLAAGAILVGLTITGAWTYFWARRIQRKMRDARDGQRCVVRERTSADEGK